MGGWMRHGGAMTRQEAGTDGTEYGGEQMERLCGGWMDGCLAK